VTTRYRVARLEDLSRVAALEAASYPADEAASPERLGERVDVAADCFLVAEEDGRLLGFVCGTRSADPTLTHDSMTQHVAHGPSLCIHSVVVDAALRRKGLGSRMLRAYQDHARTLAGVERLLLICKEHLLDFYAGVGFELVGPSAVVHGQDPWFEMRLGISQSGD
jgi:GNAT superfamily N-acetyltransferase